jgi:hypothetical protein
LFPIFFEFVQEPIIPPITKIAIMKKRIICLIVKILFIDLHFIFFGFFSQYIFQPILGAIAHNVPAVYDGFLCPIKERGAFQGTKNCGWSVAWEWSEAE